MEKLDNEKIQFITEFEKLTKTNVKNIYEHQNKMIVLVDQGEAKTAVGQGGKTLVMLEQKFGKKLKIIEYNSDLHTFIQNVMLPLKASKIEDTGEGEVTVYGTDEKTRGLMIGAKAQNLRFTEQVVQKYFPDLKEIKVVADN